MNRNQLDIPLTRGVTPPPDENRVNLALAWSGIAKTEAIVLGEVRARRRPCRIDFMALSELAETNATNLRAASRRLIARNMLLVDSNRLLAFNDDYREWCDDDGKPLLNDAKCLRCDQIPVV